MLALSGCLPLFLQQRTLVRHVPFRFRRSNVMEYSWATFHFPTQRRGIGLSNLFAPPVADNSDHPRALGLWDMLDCWGYLNLTTGQALAYAETALEQDRARTGGGVAGHGTSKLDPHGSAADLVENQCNDVLRIMEPYRDELGPIPTNIEILKVTLQQSRKHHHLELFTNDVLDDVRKIKNDFRALLSQCKFYYLAPAAARFYGDRKS